jgi:hypothetical protein
VVAEREEFDTTELGIDYLIKAKRKKEAEQLKQKRKHKEEQ